MPLEARFGIMALPYTCTFRLGSDTLVREVSSYAHAYFGIMPLVLVVEKLNFHNFKSEHFQILKVTALDF